MDFYNLWLHHSVCFPSCTFFHRPSLPWICAAGWKWNESSSPIFALSQSQARSFWERNDLSVIHSRPPKCSSFSFLCAEVALSILIVACMTRIIIYSVCKVINRKFDAYRTLPSATMGLSSLCFNSLLPLVLCDRFCGFYIPIPGNFPAVECICNASWSALISRFS